MTRWHLSALARRADALHGEALGEERLFALAGGRANVEPSRRLRDVLRRMADVGDTLIDCGTSPHSVEQDSRGWLKFVESANALCIREPEVKR